MPLQQSTPELFPRRRGDTRRQGVLARDPYTILESMQENVCYLISQEKKRKETIQDDEGAVSKQ